MDIGHLLRVYIYCFNINLKCPKMVLEAKFEFSKDTLLFSTFKSKQNKVCKEKLFPSRYYFQTV